MGAAPRSGANWQGCCARSKFVKLASNVCNLHAECRNKSTLRSNNYVLAARKTLASKDAS